MLRKNILNLLLFVVLSAFLSGCVSAQKFKGYTQFKDDEITLKGHLYKPSGEGPFPAIVITPGCAGITKRARMWASRLKGWGYVAFIVNSFASRGIGNDCGKIKKASSTALALDVHSAKVYLSQQTFCIFA